MYRMISELANRHDASAPAPRTRLFPEQLPSLHPHQMAEGSLEDWRALDRALEARILFFLS